MRKKKTTGNDDRYMVNLKGTHSEIFYCELEELANQLTAQENHNV